MIAFVRGVLRTLASDHAIVESSGIGYLIYAPRRVLANLGPIGAEVLLHTHLYMREDLLALYGFATPEELRMFTTLLSVSGVGPKVALAMLSSATPNELQMAIASGDTKQLARVPGIGQKTAARLVLELKGKVDITTLSPTNTPPVMSGVNADLADMLTSLGFSAAEAARAIAALPADAPDDIEERLRLALQFFGSV